MNIDIKPAIQLTKILGFRVSYLQLFGVLLILSLIYFYLNLLKFVSLQIIYFTILYIILREKIDFKKIIVIFLITYINGLLIYLYQIIPVSIIILMFNLSLLLFILRYMLDSPLSAVLSVIYIIIVLYISVESEQLLSLFFLSLFLWLFNMIIFFYFITSATFKIFNTTLKDLFSKFFASWFYDDPALEIELQKMGRDKEIDVEVVYLKIGGEIVYLIFPNFHFGPFGNIGSADAPALFNQYINNNLVFHGLNHHDRDVTNRESIERLVLEILKTPIDKFKKLKMKYKKYDKDSAKANVLFSEDFTIIGLTRYPNTTEDVYSSAGELLRLEIKDKIKNPIIFDQHDSDAKTIKYFSSDSDEFLEYKGVLQKIRTQEDLYPVKGRYSKIYCTDNGVSSNGINILQLFIGGQKIVIINIDGNGITKNSHEKLEQLADKYDYVLILSTSDSHEGNDVAGIVNDVELSSNTINLIESILKQDPQDEVYYNYKKFTFTLNIIGEETPTKLLIYLRMSVNFLIAMLLTTIIVNIMLVFLNDI